MPKRNTAEVFWSRVAVTDNPDDCWEWARYRANGYGRVGWNGVSALAHRVAYELAKGPIPEGMCVCHTCDNPPCCNPNHLWLGTHTDNAMDRESKGRNRPPVGAAHPRTRLTAEDVRVIRSMPGDHAVAARQFGVHRSTIRRIRLRKNWKWT